MKVTLLGHPNSGKTSVFNKLTNKKLKTANFAGVTVDIYQSTTNILGKDIEFTDLPGINSLSSFSDSKDEMVVSKYISENPNDLYLNIVNIGQLKRHLLLTLNALSNNLNLILVVNMIDTADISSDEINKIKAILINDLEIPVVFVSAKKNTGFDELKNHIINYNIESRLKRKKSFSKDILENNLIVSKITKKFKKISIKSNLITNKLDKLLLNNFIAVPVFFLSIYIILLITMNIHAIFSDIIDQLAGLYFVNGLMTLLEKTPLPQIIIILLSDGIGGGLQTMLTFLPIIFTLFFLLGLLEESGYTARQAFIADGIMQKIGLPGKAFVSLVMGLGCTAACSSGCRTLERESDRRLSLMISPSISCSAKLPVYVYFCFIVFTSNAVNMVFFMYAIGIIFAVINGLFLSRSLFRTKSLPFLIELPDYRIPNFSNVFLNSLKKVRSFLINLGKVIIPIIAVINLLNSVNFSGNIVENNDESIMAKSAQFVTPLFSPLGIDKNNWEATVSLITGFLAKEVVVATLNDIYFPNLEGTSEDLSIIKETKNILYGAATGIFSMNYLDVFDYTGSVNAVSDNLKYKQNILMGKFKDNVGIFAFLLFFLLYTPCVSAMGAIAIELGKQWSFLVGFWSLFNAFAISSSYYQIASKGVIGLYFVSIIVFIYCIIFVLFKIISKKYSKDWETNFVFNKKSSSF